MKNFFQSKTFTVVLYGIGGVALALIIFQAGVFVGYHKAAFSYQFGEEYYEALGGPRGAMMRGIPHDDFTSIHGAMGRIIKINLPTLVLESPDRVEKIVNISDDTVIRRFRENISASDLRVDDFATVIGSPNAQAEIDAKLIRLLPFMPNPAAPSTTPTSSQPLK